MSGGIHACITDVDMHPGDILFCPRVVAMRPAQQIAALVIVKSSASVRCGSSLQPSGAAAALLVEIRIVCSANIRSQCFRQLFSKRANCVQWIDCYVSDVMCCLKEPEWAFF